MSEMLKQYEISVWEDELVTPEDGESYYQEKKIAIIGGDDFPAPQKVYDPILTENINGEKTLTFSLQHYYFDEKVGDYVFNPIFPLLVNERKVKLYYNDKWYDFIIKECQEDSENQTFSYTATDVFINELSKQGYNIEFATDLNNNLGTITELGAEVIKNTDWFIDEEDCDLLQQTVQEPIYGAIINENFSALNVNTGESTTIYRGEKIFVFYSYIFTGDFTNVQFLRDLDKPSWEYDDNDTIKGTNYRYEGNKWDDLIYQPPEEEGEDSLPPKYSPYYDNQAYRLVYQSRVIFDPVMQKEVELYRITYGDKTTQDVYKAVNTEYNVSSIVTSVITNGNDFAVADKAEVSGWDGDVAFVGNEQPLATLYSYPIIGLKDPLISLDKFNQLSSYLKIEPQRTIQKVDGDYRNFVFNRGFMDNGARIDNISKGEEYAFRIRSGRIDGADNTQPLNDNTYERIRAYVAYYKTIQEKVKGVLTEVKTFSDKDIIFKFGGTYQDSPNKITGGDFNETNTAYIIDNVPQTPSMKYIYVGENDEEKVWNPFLETPQFVSYEDKNSINWFLDTHISTAKAEMTVTNEKLTDPTVRIGIFIGIQSSTGQPDDAAPRYIGDVEIFKVLRDTEGNIILPGNIPTTLVTNRELYYLKPEAGAQATSMNTYSSKEALASDLGVEEDLIKQIYNENCEKVLSIEESKSNIFNILQTLCETFECWLKINVEHERNGAIKLDENHKPIKKIAFKEYIGEENSAGFKYGINLNSISRTVDSNEVVTKLIVADTASDYVDGGTLSISYADANPLKESVIYDLDYYIQKGLIKDKDQYNIDLNNLYEKVGPINQQIQELSYTLTIANNALVNVKSQANVYVETITAAQDAYNKALRGFEEVAGIPYSQYVDENQTEEDEDKAETLIERVGEIYTAQSTLNNISGPEAAAYEEYRNLFLKINGAPNFTITVSTTESEERETEDDDAVTLNKAKVLLNDYKEGFVFTLKSGDNEKTFTTSLNDKEFEFLTENPITYLIVNDVPDNYLFEYTHIDTGEVHRVKSGRFQIYTEGGMVRKFALVPTEEYKKECIGYQEQIDELIEERQTYINNFERKYRQYIQEGTWEETSYIDSNLYYFDALQVAHTSAKPQITYTINVTEISTLEGLDGYTFAIGDKTYVEDTEFFGWVVDKVEIKDVSTGEKELQEIYTPVQEEVILSEIEWHLDDPSQNTITVQNYKTQFEDLFQRISATVQSVQYNESSYLRAAKILDGSGVINKNLLSKSIDGLIGETYPISPYIKIDDSGIIAQDQQAQSNLVKLAGNGIFTSVDGGKSWQNVLNANGITTDSLTAGTINTQNIQIMDGDNTSFRWDQYGLSAYGGYESGGAYDLTSFVRMDKFGIYGINDGGEYQFDNLEDVVNKAHFSLTWDGFRIKSDHGNGYVSISSDNDFEVVRVFKTTGRVPGSSTIEVPKIKIGALEYDSEGVPTKYGINIYNDSGEPVFTTNDDGNIAITGRINATGGDFSGTIQVGEDDRFILINGEDAEPFIASSDYLKNSSAGWIINATGDAIFNNISVRGAIKTAVFEYSEIEAVGGAFLFRPSSSIKTVTIVNDTDLAIIVEQPELFRLYEWVKLSNENASIENGGLSHVYQIKEIANGAIILDGAANNFADINEAEIEAPSLIPIPFTFIQDTTYQYETFLSGPILKEDHIYTLSINGKEYTTDKPVYNTSTQNWEINTEDFRLVNTLVNEEPKLRIILPFAEPQKTYEELDTTGIEEFTETVYEYDEVNNTYFVSQDTAPSLGFFEFSTTGVASFDGLVVYEFINDGYVVTQDEAPVVYYEPLDTSEIEDFFDIGFIVYEEGDETGTYIETTDEEPVPGKTYYTTTGKTYYIEEEKTYYILLTNILIPFYIFDATFGNSVIADLEGGALISFGYAENTYTPTTILENSNPKDLGLYEISNIKVNFNEVLNELGLNQIRIHFIDVDENEYTVIWYEDNETLCYITYVGEQGEAQEEVSTEVYYNSTGWTDEKYREIIFTENWDFINSDLKEWLKTNADIELIYTLTNDEQPITGKTYYKEYYNGGRNNYGIGINSSDDYINLPGRAISLFEANIHPQDLTKVTYDYKGILGTLPSVSEGLPDNDIYRGMEGTQGIFTNNMYIGDAEQYIAFYSDEDGDHHLDIVGSSVNMALADGENLINIINANTKEGVKIHADQLDVTDRMIVGDVNGYHIAINSDENEIGFWSGAEDNEANKTAFVSNNKLWIPYSVVLNEMQVGEGTDENGLWSWRVTSDERLRLVWLGKNEDVKPDEGGDDDDNASSS